MYDELMNKNEQKDQKNDARDNKNECSVPLGDHPYNHNMQKSEVPSTQNSQFWLYENTNGYKDSNNRYSQPCDASQNSSQLYQSHTCDQPRDTHINLTMMIRINPHKMMMNPDITVGTTTTIGTGPIATTVPTTSRALTASPWKTTPTIPAKCQPIQPKLVPCNACSLESSKPANRVYSKLLYQCSRPYCNIWNVYCPLCKAIIQHYRLLCPESWDTVPWNTGNQFRMAQVFESNYHENNP